MYNFDPYNVLLSIATNIAVLLMTAFVLQRHIFVMFLLSEPQKLDVSPEQHSLRQTFLKSCRK